MTHTIAESGSPSARCCPRWSERASQGALRAAEGALDDCVSQARFRIDEAFAESCQHLHGGLEAPPVDGQASHAVLASAAGAGPSGHANGAAVIAAAAVAELTVLGLAWHDRVGCGGEEQHRHDRMAVLGGDHLFAYASSLLAPLGGPCAQVQAEALALHTDARLREAASVPQQPSAGQRRSGQRRRDASLVIGALCLGQLAATGRPEMLGPVRQFGFCLALVGTLTDGVASGADEIRIRRWQNRGHRVLESLPSEVPRGCLAAALEAAGPS